MWIELLWFLFHDTHIDSLPVSHSCSVSSCCQHLLLTLWMLSHPAVDGDATDVSACVAVAVVRRLVPVLMLYAVLYNWPLRVKFFLVPCQVCLYYG